MQKYLMIICVVLLTGCFSLKDTTESGAASAKANAELHATVLKPAQVLGNGNTFSGNVTIGEVPLTETDINSKLKTDIETTYSKETKICAALAIFFLACSLGITAIFLPILVTFLKQSKAIKATASLVDTGIASMANMAANSTDTSKIAEAHNARAMLESLKKHL